MYIPLKPILERYNISPAGVIQIGSHWAEEHEDFLKCGIEMFVYIEPCKEAFNVLMKKFYNGDGIFYEVDKKIKLLNVACGAEEKYFPMYVSHQNQGQSNSFLEPKLHLQYHPEIVFDDAEVVKMVTLDSLPIEKYKYSLLVMDTEGYEMEVLKGAEDTIKSVDIIYTEVQRAETRVGNVLIDELDTYLDQRGFVRVETYWPSPSWGWGDAIFLRKTLLP
jgi:FkbM family methyltransferase